MMQAKDGTIKHGFFSAGTIYLDNNDEPAMLTVMHDNTENRATEEALRSKEFQLQRSQKMETVGILAGGVAHEFNNLLFIIAGTAEMLLTNAKQEGKGFLQEIVDTTQRGATLVKQLMAFSRKSEMGLHPTQLNDELNQAIKMLDRILPRMINMEIDLADNLHSINADTGQIEQVVLNLCLNSKDAMPNGGTLSIKTENCVIDESFISKHSDKPINLNTGRGIILTVADTGCGMNKKTLEHIFDPFFTTKKIGQGTGLGLSVIYGIIEGHGGNIFWESEPGGGTTFKIYFSASTKYQKASPSGEEKGKSLFMGSETILVTDDEKAILDFMEVVLKREGYTVISADSGETALEIYALKKPDLVVLDLGMPGMGGKTALKQLIELDRDAKVIVASGYADNDALEEIEAGAKAFIQKPFAGSALLKQIRDILDAK